MKQRLQQLLKKPSSYAIVYLLAIPSFALVYQNYWQELQQSTGSQDAITSQLGYALGQSLDPYLRQTLRANPAAFQAAISAESVTGPFPGDSATVDFIWSVPYRETDGSLGSRFAAIRVEPPGSIFISDKPGTVNVPVSIRFTPPELAEQYRELMRHRPFEERAFLFQAPTKVGGVGRGELVGDLQIPVRLAERINMYVAARQGHPAPAPGGFGRYLYFSVVTITTLGYGDIIPLTDRLRLWVGFESLFGVVFAGLFINAVASRPNAPN